MRRYQPTSSATTFNFRRNKCAYWLHSEAHQKLNPLLRSNPPDWFAVWVRWFADERLNLAKHKPNANMSSWVRTLKHAQGSMVALTKCSFKLEAPCVATRISRSCCFVHKAQLRITLNMPTVKVHLHELREFCISKPTFVLAGVIKLVTLFPSCQPQHFRVKPCHMIIQP